VVSVLSLCWQWHTILICQLQLAKSMMKPTNTVDSIGAVAGNILKLKVRYIIWNIKFKLAPLTHNTLNSSQPAYLRSLLSYHILYAPPTPICCRFLGSTQPLLPAVSALLSPQYGTHSLLPFVLVRHHIHSIVFLKPTVSTRPHNCLFKRFFYLLIYSLT